MNLTDNWLLVKEAVEYLRLNGVRMTGPHLRVLISLGRIPSRKILGNRMVGRNDLARYAARKKEGK